MDGIGRVQDYSRIFFCHRCMYICSKIVLKRVFKLMMILLILRNCFSA